MSHEMPHEMSHAMSHEVSHEMSNEIEKNFKFVKLKTDKFEKITFETINTPYSPRSLICSMTQMVNFIINYLMKILSIVFKKTLKEV